LDWRVAAGVELRWNMGQGLWVGAGSRVGFGVEVR